MDKILLEVGGTQSRQNFPEVGPDLKLRRGGIAVGAAAAAATGALAGGGGDG